MCIKCIEEQIEFEESEFNELLAMLHRRGKRIAKLKQEMKKAYE